MELKEKKTSVIQGLGASLVANFSPSFTTSGSFDTPPTIPENVRVFTQSDLANLTLHQVAREGDVMLMEKLLERVQQMQQRKKRLNAKDDSKLTPMHYAARYNHYHMISYLIKNGANVQVKGEDDVTPLHFLAKYKKKRAVDTNATDDDAGSSDEELPPEETFSCLKLLVDNGAQVNANDAMGLTPLHHACTRGNTSAVRELVECVGIGLEMTDNQGMTPLHLACLYGHLRIVNRLVEAGSNLRCKDKDATTPLHLVCAEGSLEIAKLLLEKAETDLEQERENLIAQAEENHQKDNSKSKNHGRHTSTGNNKTTLDVNNVVLTTKGGAAELLQEIDGDKNLPFHLAIENGHLNLVEFCMERAKNAGLGNMVHRNRTRDESCLHLAVQSNNLEIVKLLIEEGADINARNSSLVTPLFLASQHNSHVLVKFLLEKGANIELKDSDFMTPLLIASRYGHLETITWLLKYNADITETDKDDRTCLMWAADEDRTDAIKLLLQRNKIRLMIEERDKYNNTGLHLASTKGHVATVKLLLEFRAPADVRNDDDRTTLHMAALHGHDVIIPDLIHRDRSVINVGDEEANTALHLAAIGGNIKCVTALIQLGANIELRNAKQWTPLDCAAAFGWEKAARALLEAGASVQPRGKIKVCALHLACQRGHVEMINLLLQWKADVTFRAGDGRNALDFAIDCSQKECVLALIKHESWQLSLKNAVVNPVTGIATTPMRKLIRKMEDMAEIVCNQCISDNGKKPEDDDFAVTLLYEFFDDTFACSEWFKKSEATTTRPSSATVESAPLMMDDNVYAVYDEHDTLTEDARTYDDDSDVLKENHPLNIMVSSKCERLLVHPIVTGLLHYKWTHFGRYVYYITLLLFVVYVIALNVYLMLVPPFYVIDWLRVIQCREQAAAGASFTSECTNHTSACFYYREGVGKRFSNLEGCQTLNSSELNLRWVIFAFSIFNLAREAFQMINQKLNYLEFTNAIEICLYLLSLLLSIDFTQYNVEEGLRFLTSSSNSSGDPDFAALDGFQADTGLRQEWQQEIGAFAVFFSWMGLLLFIQKFPRLGIFVVMFTDIVRTFVQFLPVFIFFIFGFAFSFNILIGNQLVFESWYESLVTITVMMIGELDYGNIFFSGSEGEYESQLYTREVSFVLFTTFLIVMTIIIMNLLVGLAVGDIIQVQEHATLERLGMQVDATLETEFTMPAFLRKRFCLRKQRIEVNKYRKANFFKRLFLRSQVMTIEHLSKAVDDDAADQDENRSSSDRILSGLSSLRGRMSDLLNDHAEVKQGMRNVRALVRDVKREAKNQCDEIKESLALTGVDIGQRIDVTRTGLAEKTQQESTQTRGKVDSTREVVAKLKEDIELTKVQIQVVRSELEKRMDVMQEALLARSWESLEAGLRRCDEKVETTRKEILESLEEMKLVLVKEKYMSNV